MRQDTRLILVDGNAVVYRAYFAIQELSTAEGRPTNAVFGFVRMLDQIRNTWAPTHLAVIFDGGLSEERVSLLPDYKAQRPSMPDPLRKQIPDIEEYLDCRGVAWCRQQGQEADDVLASLTAVMANRADEVLIATGDKDMYQLVSQECRVIPVSGKSAVMGPGEVKEKTGVPPERIVEWLALTGDSSDNIPGVPGVGKKTAAKLLDEYGSLVGMWQHLQELSGVKLKQSLQDHREDVARNIDMIRLRKDLDCCLSWDAMEVREADSTRLLAFLEKMEFGSMAATIRQPDLFDSV